jgi:hypothetical protein
VSEELLKFGAKAFDALFDAFVDGQFEIEVFDFIARDAVKAGLVEKVPYDPEVHDNGEDCEPGDDYFVLTPAGKIARDGGRG